MLPLWLAGVPQILIVLVIVLILSRRWMTDLGSFAEMDESSDEDLDFFVMMDVAASKASRAAGALQLLRRAGCIELVLPPLSEGPLHEWMVLVRRPEGKMGVDARNISI